MESARFRIGDRLIMGTVILEVTSPRIPCNTLATRMGDSLFVKKFRLAERPGLYCRVIQEGWVRNSDSVSLEPYPGETVSVIEMFRDFYKPNMTEAAIRRYLAAPISARSRADMEEQLHKLSLD
jgi:MOSC domain-containing protein YiiM